jgi:hypothetical protein
LSSLIFQKIPKYQQQEVIQKKQASSSHYNSGSHLSEIVPKNCINTYDSTLTILHVVLVGFSLWTEMSKSSL